MANLDYGLELTNNSKVGWAFSLPRADTCINATALCKRLCYGNGIRYQSEGQKAKRARNFRTSQYLLAEGGPELLAENLSMLVDQARPRDWLTAKIEAFKLLFLGRFVFTMSVIFTVPTMFVPGPLLPRNTLDVSFGFILEALSLVLCSMH